MGRKLNKTKAKQAILYVSHKMADEASFGSIVLAKILYYLDHAYYVATGKTITGFRYVKQVNGPTPHPAEFLSLKREMIKDKELREEEVPYFGKLQKRCVAVQPPNVTCFSSQEISVMDEIICGFKGVNAKTASDVSHEELSWKLAEQMEELPPFTFLLSEGQLTSEDIEWANKVIKEHRKSSEKQTLTHS